MLTINESDWRILRSLRPVLLERYCQLALFSAGKIIEDKSKTYHQRYGDLYSLIKQRDKALEIAFDDITRSNALSRMAFMRSGELFTEDEYGRFSQETREAVNQLVESYGHG